MMEGSSASKEALAAKKSITRPPLALLQVPSTLLGAMMRSRALCAHPVSIQEWGCSWKSPPTRTGPLLANELGRDVCQKLSVGLIGPLPG